MANTITFTPPVSAEIPSPSSTVFTAGSPWSIHRLVREPSTEVIHIPYTDVTIIPWRGNMPDTYVVKGTETFTSYSAAVTGLVIFNKMQGSQNAVLVDSGDSINISGLICEGVRNTEIIRNLHPGFHINYEITLKLSIPAYVAPP